MSSDHEVTISIRPNESAEARLLQLSESGCQLEELRNAQRQDRDKAHEVALSELAHYHERLLHVLGSLRDGETDRIAAQERLERAWLSQAEQIIQDLQEEAIALARDAACARAQAQTADATQADLQQQLRRLMDDLSASHEVNSQLQAESETLRVAAQSADAKVKQATAQSTTLSKQLQEAMEAFTDAGLKEHALQDELSHLKTKFNELVSELEPLRLDKQTLQEQVRQADQELRPAFERATEELTAVRSKLEASQRDAADLRGQLLHTRAELESTLSQTAAATEQLTSIREQFEATQREAALAGEQLSSIQEQLNASTSELEQVRANSELAENELGTLRTLMGGLRSDRDEARARVDEISNAHDIALSALRKDRDARIATMEAERDQLLASSKAETARVDRELQKAKQDLTDARGKLERVVAELNVLKKGPPSESLASEKSKMRRQLEEAWAEKAEVVRELQETKRKLCTELLEAQTEITVQAQTCMELREELERLRDQRPPAKAAHRLEQLSLDEIDHGQKPKAKSDADKATRKSIRPRNSVPPRKSVAPKGSSAAVPRTSQRPRAAPVASQKPSAGTYSITDSEIRDDVEPIGGREPPGHKRKG